MSVKPLVNIQLQQTEIFNEMKGIKPYVTYYYLFNDLHELGTREQYLSHYNNIINLIIRSSYKDFQNSYLHHNPDIMNININSQFKTDRMFAVYKEMGPHYVYALFLKGPSNNYNVFFANYGGDMLDNTQKKYLLLNSVYLFKNVDISNIRDFLIFKYDSLINNNYALLIQNLNPKFNTPSEDSDDNIIKIKLTPQLGGSCGFRPVLTHCILLMMLKHQNIDGVYTESNNLTKDKDDLSKKFYNALIDYYIIKYNV